MLRSPLCSSCLPHVLLDANTVRSRTQARPHSNSARLGLAAHALAARNPLTHILWLFLSPCALNARSLVGPSRRRGLVAPAVNLCLKPHRAPLSQGLHSLKGSTLRDPLSRIPLSKAPLSMQYPSNTHPRKRSRHAGLHTQASLKASLKASLNVPLKRRLPHRASLSEGL